MPKNLNCYEQYEFLEEFKKLVTQAKDLFETAGCCPPEEHSKPAFIAGLMADFSAALAATAAKSGLWCINVNQNGVANNANTYPDHDRSLENLIDRLTEIRKTEIIMIKNLQSKPSKETPLEEMELEQPPVEPEFQETPYPSGCLATDPQKPGDFALWRIAAPSCLMLPHR